MIYLDSSVLLELYLDGARAAQARAILDLPEAKVASWPLTVEVPVVLRRALSRPGDRKVLALLLKEWTGHAVRFETFDERLGLLAGELNLH
jgi:predicted nucleic acid-binding protein